MTRGWAHSSGAGTGAAVTRRAVGALLVLIGAAALWGAFSLDWDLSEDWDAGVFVGWFPMSFEFLGLVAVVGVAGTILVLGLLLLLGNPALVARSGVRGRGHPKEVEKWWAEVLRQDPKTRTHAKRALVEIGGPAVPKLVEILARPDRPLDPTFRTSAHSTAIRILDLMGPMADAPIRDLLVDKDPVIRQAAVHAQSALGRLRAERRG